MKKFSDLVNDSLSINELLITKGGSTTPPDGCQSGICSVKINPEYCNGGAVCTSGIAGVITPPPSCSNSSGAVLLPCIQSL